MKLYEFYDYESNYNAIFTDLTTARKFADELDAHFKQQAEEYGDNEFVYVNGVDYDIFEIETDPTIERWIADNL